MFTRNIHVDILATPFCLLTDLRENSRLISRQSFSSSFFKQLLQENNNEGSLHTKHVLSRRQTTRICARRSEQRGLGKIAFGERDLSKVTLLDRLAKEER